MKTGKRPALHKPTDIKLATVFQDQLQHPEAQQKIPVVFGHGSAYHNWKMLGNDQHGDCVWAGAGHETMLTNRLAGKSVVFDDAHTLADYAEVTGFDPATGANDNGTVVATALSFRRHKGVQDHKGTRHKIGAYVSIKPGDWNELVFAMYWFTCVGIGFAFPSYAMDQFNNNEPWDYKPGVDDNPQDGHYVCGVGRKHADRISVVSWGKTTEMTQPFGEHFIDETWAMVYTEELQNGKTWRGLDLSGLNNALQQLPTAH